MGGAARLQRMNTVEERSSDIENRMVVNIEKLTEIANMAPNVLIQVARDKGIIASLGLRQGLLQ